jgi:hypothetical protein
MIFQGSFDGFPTGACVDAGLRKTAIFAADELHLNTHFVDGKDIVVIPHDAAKIVEIIESYYRGPEQLKMVAESGARRVRELYSYESQIGPRVTLLREQLELAKLRPARTVVTFAATAASSVGVRLWRSCPSWLQIRIKMVIRATRSNEVLFRAIKRLCPKYLIRVYRKVRASQALP